jgi:hypothetical protein
MAVGKTLKPRALAWGDSSEHTSINYAKSMGIARHHRDRNAIGVQKLEHLKRHVATYRVVTPRFAFQISLQLKRFDKAF